MNNCDIGGCESKGPIVCPTCKHWKPSRSSKYYYCTRYLSGRVTCDLPKSACKTCPFYDGPGEKGRSNLTGVNWSDKDSVREYSRQRMQSIRRERKDAADRRQHGIPSKLSRDGRACDECGNSDGDGVWDPEDLRKFDEEISGTSFSSMLRLEDELEEESGPEV